MTKKDTQTTGLMSKETTFIAGCTVRGLFANGKARKHGEMIKNDLAEKGINVVPVTQRVGLGACMLMLEVTCEESVEEQIKSALDPLGFDFMEVKPTEGREAFVTKAEEISSSLQIEIHRCAKEKLSSRLGEEVANKLSLMIADYVFSNAPEEDTDSILLEQFQAEMPGILAGFNDTFKMNATGVLIILAAARKIDLEIFKSHMVRLAHLGFTQLGGDTPDVSAELPDEDIVYQYEAASALDQR